MERVHALTGLGHVLVGRLLVGPAHVQADGLDPSRPLSSELLVEARERRRVLALLHPHDGAGSVVVGDDGQVAVSFSVADLVDSDPVEVAETRVVELLGDISRNDAGHGLEAHPQQPADRRLVSSLGEVETTSWKSLVWREPGRAQGTSSVRTRPHARQSIRTISASR